MLIQGVIVIFNMKCGNNMESLLTFISYCILSLSHPFGLPRHWKNNDRKITESS